MTEFEFRTQTNSQKFTLYLLRAIVLGLIASSIFFYDSNKLGGTNGLLNTIGGVMVGIWIYSNLLQAKIEVQELFIPPYNLNNAPECTIIAVILMTASWFF